MRTTSIIAALVLLLISSSLSFAQEVTYSAGDTTLKGYLAMPGEGGKLPGVLVVHEWWGLNDYARMRADMLAKLGYVAFAVDMYGDGVTTADPKKAGELSGSVGKNPQVAIARFTAALAELKKNPRVDPDRIAAVGYCFGGTTVLNMARTGLDLKGVVSFHGGLAPVEGMPSGEIKAKILVCHGGADGFITKAQFDAFLKEMADAGAEWQVSIYGKAKHSFTNPNADKVGIEGIAYNKTADERSWGEMEMFLKEVLGR